MSCTFYHNLEKEIFLIMQMIHFPTARPPAMPLPEGLRVSRARRVLGRHSALPCLGRGDRPQQTDGSQQHGLLRRRLLLRTPRENQEPQLLWGHPTLRLAAATPCSRSKPVRCLLGRQAWPCICDPCAAILPSINHAHPPNSATSSWRK